MVLTVIGATLLMASASPQDGAGPSPKGRAEKSASKVKELQKERIATLKEMADAITTMFQGGQASYDEVLEAKLLVFNAELDAAEKQSERTTLYKNIVDELKKLETLADKRVKFAREPRAFFLKVKARRLEAEIALERAKAKDAR